jgi:hypothetical protein
MNTTIKKYILDILWALILTLFEVSVIGLVLFLLCILPHGLSFLCLTYFQCIIIICVYRIITYKFNTGTDSSANDDHNTSETNMYSDMTPPPVKNIYSQQEMDSIHEPTYSVRE